MPADTNKPKRYVVTYDGGFIAWQYREAKDSDKGERIWYRECDYAALAAENERLRKASEWHSKDTLPKEGVDVLCMSGNFMFVGWVDRHGIWQSSDDSRFVPDCWMPLPQAPAKEGDAK